MITFKQFILEDEDDVVELMELLKRDCAQYLSESKGNLLYRGMKNFGTPSGKLHFPANEEEERKELTAFYYKKSIRTDRQPKSTSEIIHNYMDDWFEKKFGVRPRGAGMFCHSYAASGRISIYGNPAIVFPIGDFETIWSPTVIDLYDDFEANEITRRSSRGDVEFLLDHAKYRKGNLQAATQTPAEIMIVGSSYYAVPIGQGRDWDWDLRDAVMAQL